jgi:hypothetical protein
MECKNPGLAGLVRQERMKLRMVMRIVIVDDRLAPATRTNSTSRPADPDGTRTKAE